MNQHTKTDMKTNTLFKAIKAEIERKTIAERFVRDEYQDSSVIGYISKKRLEVAKKYINYGAALLDWITTGRYEATSLGKPLNIDKIKRSFPMACILTDEELREFLLENGMKISTQGYISWQK